MSSAQLDIILSRLDELGLEIAESDELEEITDVLIDLLLERLPFPRWLPFVKGYVRRKLDEFLPSGLLRAIREAVEAVKARKRLHTS